MRVMRRNHIAAAAASLVAWVLPLVSAISVPTGKLTPITPARPTPRTVNPHAPANPAPVVEYSEANPEPPPLDPSYVPQQFNYFDTLAKHHIYYFPVRYRNFNAISNHIEYEPPQKFHGQTLGKNVGYKPYTQQLTVPYYPVWASQRYQPTSQQYQPNNQQYQPNDQQYQPNNQQYQPNNQLNNQYSQGNQYNPQANNQYSQQSSQNYNNQYQQPPQQQQQQQQQQPQQQYEAVSTQSSPASTAPAPAPQGSAPVAPVVPKVDYSTGKGSYDVTGKGGSKSEYYTKADWSKKTTYPKKVLSSRNSKFLGKY